MKPPRKQWFYFITDSNNVSILWDAFAKMPVKQSVVAPQPIPQNPTGWRDIEVQAATNLKYFSLNRTFVTNIKFINDGANILRWYAYNDRGYDEDLYVIIYQWNRITGINEVCYKGKLDFTTFKDDVNIGVTFATKEGGVLEYLNANDGITQEIVCDETNAAALLVHYDGINLQDKFNYQFVNAELIDDSAAHVFAAPLVFLNNEGDNIGIVRNDSPFGLYNSLADMQASESYVLYSVFGITVTITGKLQFSWATDAGDGLPGRVIVAWSTDQGQNFVKFDGGLGVGDGSLQNPTIADISQTITLAPNERLFFDIELDDTPTRNFRVTPVADDFSLTFISRNAPTNSYALTWYDWWKQAVNKMCDGKFNGDSVFLAGRKDLVVTCGDALRNTDRAVVPHYLIASTVADGFKSMSAICDLALDIIDGILYIEPKTVIYKSDNPDIFELGELSSVAIEPATNLLINDIQCGFPDQQYDERNGKYEFNSEQEWKAPVTLAAQQIFDIRSVWRGDAFGIEFIRAALTKLDTTDNAGDKQPFMVHINTTPVMQTNYEAFQVGDKTYSDGDTVLYGFFGGDNFDPAPDNKSIIYNGSTQVINIKIEMRATDYDPLITIALYKNDVLLNSFIYTLNGDLATYTLNGLLIENGDILKVVFAISTVFPDTPPFTVSVFNLTVSYALSVYNLFRDVYDALSGVLDNTIYNLLFSPHRSILAHAAYLGGLLTQMQMDSLTLATNTKNVELSTTIVGITITEKAAIPVSTLTPPLFLPYYISFKCIPPYTFSKTIATIKGGFIHGTHNGIDLYFLAFGQMNAKPATSEVQDWKLLLAPNNILSNLLKLSEQGLFLDYMGNLLFISDLNPVHFVKYDYTPASPYSFKDIYDDWVKKRNDRWSVQPNYIQPWKVGDSIELQFITAGLGAIQIDVKDCDGNTIQEGVTAEITDAAVQPPYLLQQISIQNLPAGSYYLVLSYGGVILAISEMQKFSVDEKAYRYDYFSTYNKLYGYFSQWRPCIRCDSILMQPQPNSDYENYEDDPGDVEILDYRSNMFRNLILGTPDGIGGSGLPDFMMNKMNEILLLNQCWIENAHYTRSPDSKIEPTQRQGNPFDFYTVSVQKAKNEKGLSFTDIAVPTENGIISYTFDATGFGMQEGILRVDVEDES